MKAILLNGENKEPENLIYYSTGGTAPEKIVCIEKINTKGKYIYQCGECGHTWIEDEELEKGEICCACERGEL